MRFTFMSLALCLAACGESGGAGDTDADGDADGDTDGDADGDADEEPDADEEVDADGEFDADEEVDGDGDAPPWWEEPIEAPAGEWTWVDFPSARCADGSETGLGINLHPGAERAFVYLEGGGACWDYDSCFGAVPTSMHLGGFDEEAFNSLITDVYLGMTLFNREDATNPFAEAHLVFIPYCTGDVFAGDNVVEMEGTLPWERETVHFHGHLNIEAYLARLVPTFEGVDRVVLSGSSAGGFGAGLSWPFFQLGFGETRVDVLDDSGPPLRPSDELWPIWIEAWNMELPWDCVGCEESVDSYVDYLSDTLLPTNRFGLVSYDQDLIISTFFGIAPVLFEERLDRLMVDLDEEPNAHYFVLEGGLHTMFVAGYDLIESPGGLPLWRWVEEMVEDDPDWSSHRP